MKQTTKTMLAGGLIGATVMVAGSAFAALPQEARDALESNDFDAFQIAVEGTRAENLPQEIFDLKVNLYEAKNAEDQDTIDEIKSELKKYKEEQRAEHQVNKEARHEAIESGDYDAFVALAPEGRDVPSEEVFDLLGDLHEARDAEDQDAVDEIRTQLSDLGFEKQEKGYKGSRGNKDGERPARADR